MISCTRACCFLGILITSRVIAVLTLRTVSVLIMAVDSVFKVKIFIPNAHVTARDKIRG